MYSANPFSSYDLLPLHEKRKINNKRKAQDGITLGGGDPPSFGSSAQNAAGDYPWKRMGQSAPINPAPVDPTSLIQLQDEPQYAGIQDQGRTTTPKVKKPFPTELLYSGLAAIDRFIPGEDIKRPVVQPGQSYNEHPYGTGSQAIAKYGANLPCADCGKKMTYENGGGLSRGDDYGSKKKPYPSVSSSDFAGGHRSYPIPTKADAVDALRLAHLHGREDVIVKVHKKYPNLAYGGEIGGEDPMKPIAPTYASLYGKEANKYMNKDNNFAKDFISRKSNPNDKTQQYLATNAVVARSVNDPVIQFEYSNGQIAPPKSLPNKLPFGVSIDDVQNTSEGYGYFHPQTGSFVQVDPSVYNVYNKKSGTKMKSGGWIAGAVNPEHKGYCTPMTKSTCTPRRKAFAKRAKAHFKEDGGLVPYFEEGGTYDLNDQQIADLVSQGYDLQML